MKKLMKRVMAGILVGVMMITSAVSAGAEINLSLYETSDIASSKHCFISETAPCDIIDYAKEYFYSCTMLELRELGFNDKEISGMQLATAITAFEYNNCDSKYYYFPVLYNDNIIAILTAFEYDEGFYSVKFGKGKLADSLNHLNSNSKNPYSLIITDEAMFAISKDDSIEMLFLFNECLFSEETIDIPDISFDEIISSGNKETTLYTLTDYLEISDNISNFSSVYSVSKKNLNVAIVPNTTTTDYPKGVCWASASASLLKFKSDWELTALELRDYLVNTAPAGTGNLQEVYSVLDLYLSESLIKDESDAQLPFATIQNLIDGNEPIYSHWVTDDLKQAHAMIVRGYYYDMSMPSSIAAAKKISIMDPNEANYVSVTYNTPYPIGTVDYRWRCSIY